MMENEDRNEKPKNNWLKDKIDTIKYNLDYDKYTIMDRVAVVMIMLFYIVPLILGIHYLYYAFTNPDLTLTRVFIHEFEKFWFLYIPYIIIIIYFCFYVKRK